MCKKNILGKNIKCIRVAHGETQEQLGEVIGVEKNTICNYENGTREPGKDILESIANHYMLPVELLLTSELNFDRKIEANPHSFWENIDVFLPIAHTWEACNVDEFSKAHDIHKKVFESLKNEEIETIEEVEDCIELYKKAYENDTARCESAVNIVGIQILFMTLLKNVPEVLKTRPALITKLAQEDEAAKKILESDHSEFESEVNELWKMFYTKERLDKLDELIVTIKKNKKWGEAADYYMALKYIWNLVDNGYKWELNITIGNEMMKAFYRVGNTFAAQYLRNFSYDEVHNS